MKTKSFIRSKILGFLTKKLTKSLENVSAYGKTYRTARTTKNEPPFEQTLGTIQCRLLWYSSIWALFVIKDEYSRYLVVEILRGFSLSANATIPVLDKVISSFGIPKVVNTDNGSPFNSKQFAQNAEYIRFNHRNITPHWPRPNAQAGAFNKPLMKTVTTTTIEEKNWYRKESNRKLI